MLVVRTDFSDQQAWEAVRTTIETPNEDGFRAYGEVIDDPAYRDLPTDRVLTMVRQDGAEHRFMAVVDRTTLGSAEMPLLVIDQRAEPDGAIRVIATEFWSIDNNLSIANMDYEEFADAVDEDGTFRGF
ncbi:DUF6924 domain-containing protein [Actinomadura sp. 9N407]|uniref:DUF6924 domain-containing protein n=1 Tax=Actinomadura sp. 9N407 TaxID=3375154 RepID=UPI00379787AD